MVTQFLATSISVTWDQPLGADAVEGFEINYSYVIRECIRDGDNFPIPPVTVTLNNGSWRNYTIMDGFNSPVEEDSDYTISMTAVNSVGRSMPSNIVMTRTAFAGECLISVS